MKYRVGKYVQGIVQELFWDYAVVDCIIKRCVSINGPSDRFYFLCHFSRPSFFRALEDHVFDQVGNASLPFGFVNTACLNPNLYGHNRRPMVFFHNGSKSVRELGLVQPGNKFPCQRAKGHDEENGKGGQQAQGNCFAGYEHVRFSLEYAFISIFKSTR